MNVMLEWEEGKEEWKGLYWMEAVLRGERGVGSKKKSGGEENESNEKRSEVNNNNNNQWRTSTNKEEVNELKVRILTWREEMEKEKQVDEGEMMVKKQMEWPTRREKRGNYTERQRMKEERQYDPMDSRMWYRGIIYATKNYTMRGIWVMVRIYGRVNKRKEEEERRMSYGNRIETERERMRTSESKWEQEYKEDGIGKGGDRWEIRFNGDEERNQEEGRRVSEMERIILKKAEREGEDRRSERKLGKMWEEGIMRNVGRMGGMLLTEKKEGQGIVINIAGVFETKRRLSLAYRCWWVK